MLAPTQHAIFFKTDDDGYVRVLTLLDHVLNYQKAIETDKEIYFGNQMWDSGDVIRDKKNPWYMYDMYPHKKFPYYMSGSGYGMSKKLAKFASIQAAKSLILGWKMQALNLRIKVSRQKEGKIFGCWVEK